MSTPRAVRPTPRDVASRARTAVPEPGVEPYVGYDEEIPQVRDQHLEATGRHITVSLCGEAVRVVPPGAWPMSAQRAVRLGDFDTFMGAILHEDDYELYEQIDPTMDEFNAFMEDVNALAPQALGKPSGPSRSSRRTQRR